MTYLQQTQLTALPKTTRINSAARSQPSYSSHTSYKEVLRVSATKTKGSPETLNFHMIEQAPLSQGYRDTLLRTLPTLGSGPPSSVLCSALQAVALHASDS
ncbi:uncharacterized protein N7446_007043 [Penicillium canescens]|uniref:uncharacterized protein n=1 Tax=Penicillium canescens TaxID=5083 RepID=UPI0026E05983|nr:uncharacterized protein N7446_007043 [Penicillium canescens]KAJ6062923.1 hypothetical protein N7446_007043 [Penicillium canescens]